MVRTFCWNISFPIKLFSPHWFPMTEKVKMIEVQFFAAVICGRSLFSRLVVYWRCATVCLSNRFPISSPPARNFDWKFAPWTHTMKRQCTFAFRNESPFMVHSLAIFETVINQDCFAWTTAQQIQHWALVIIRLFFLFFSFCSPAKFSSRCFVFRY